ncbi:MAG: AraC family ligand binding domain-containing protein, partial [Clostridia bacterium]|nr:AraC family ligand binding domain-containing protein [Clostridia bacterium]
MSANALWDFPFHVEYSDNDKWKHPIAYTHFHKIYEIYYLLENEIMYFIDDKTYHISEGTFVIVPPYRIHTTRCLNDRVRKRILVYVPEAFVADFLKDEPDLLKRIEGTPI